MRILTVMSVCLAGFTPANAFAEYRVLAVGIDKLVIVKPDGAVEWEMPWKGGTHDLHVLDNGNIMAIRNAHEVVEVDRKTKAEVWSYNAAKSNGNSGKPVEVHAIQPLPDGAVMIAESGPGRIIEVDRSGKLLKSTALVVSKPDPHRDTRLARKLDNGNYLVSHEGDGVIREYSGKDGKVVWEFPVPMFGKEPKPGHGPEAFGNQAFSAIRLKNGNTLIGSGNGHAILEVTPEKKIVWEVHQNDLQGVTLAWVTTLTVLPNGHLVIGNCHAGPGQPQLVEIERDSRHVVWTFDQFDLLGNDLTNSVLLGKM
ncbi:MAG: PQQ-binding-like beta-propeller repeat protein [Candidatus Hydrogenedentes bacterium]|nr:PQQ-binding-like beta-propeller repeat protein [Candidatus Hydrogenedentota bacterium]